MYFGSKLKLFQVFQVDLEHPENENFKMRWARNGGNGKRDGNDGLHVVIWHQIHQAQSAAVESHRVSQLAVRREASLKKSILNFHRFGCSRCNLERGTILIWNKNNNAHQESTFGWQPSHRQIRQANGVRQRKIWRLICRLPPLCSK
jgi:hypothetical protein